MPKGYSEDLLLGGKIYCIHHDAPLIATIAAGIGLAFVFGLLAVRLKLPLLLGYLAAGLLVGPFTPGFVADANLATQLSEIGVSLLMFGVGLHFSIKDLLAVKKIAIPGAVAQIIVATLLGILLGKIWGWTFGAGLVFGICLSVASTVVLLRALKERNLVETINGRVAVGWLIVEDLVTVLALVALPALASFIGGNPVDADGHSPPGSDQSIAVVLLSTFAKVGLFVVVMLVLGKKIIPGLLGRVARTGNRELFTIGVLGVALGVAFGAAYLFNVSPALGAFFAGVIIAESDLSHQAGAEMLPLQEAFVVLFFVSVGMQFDPNIIVKQPLHVLGALFVVLVGKSLAALIIVLFFRYPLITAITISASLAQIGEFSFILIALGISLGLVPQEALSIVLAVAVISIAVNPIIFRTVEPIDNFVRARPKLLGILEFQKPVPEELISSEESKTMENHVVMIGFGRVGSAIARSLTAENIPFVVVDQDRAIIEQLHKRGIPTVFGDASRPGILKEAGLNKAKMIIVATPAKSQARQIVEYARKVNPEIHTCVRTHSFVDAVHFEEMGIERVVMGELELALEMAHFTLEQYNVPDEQVAMNLDEIRKLGARSLERTYDI